MIKKLMQSIREYKVSSILSPIFVSFEVILEVIIPLLMANLIDDGIYAGEMNAVYKIGIELVLCAICSLIFGILSRNLCSKSFFRTCKKFKKRFIL